MNIQGFQKTTLLDYPGHVAATIFFGGCSFRCPFCHNSSLVLDPDTSPAFSPEDILTVLMKRRGILDGVCITGGEPALQRGLFDFIAEIKSLGLAVKLDTNGYHPDQLIQLCEAGLIDYIAMDIKGAPQSYGTVTGLHGLEITRIMQSVEYLMSGQTSYEFRTTVVKELHKEDDFAAIGKWIAGAQAYFLQGYQDSPQVISPGFTAYHKSDMEKFKTMLQKYISRVELRGMEN